MVGWVSKDKVIEVDGEESRLSLKQGDYLPGR